MLDKLPAELLGMVIDHLDLHTTGRLRVVSRILSDNAIQGSYRSCFTKPHIELTKHDLERLVDFTFSEIARAVRFGS